MAGHKVPTCILVFLSSFVCRVTAAILIAEVPTVNECPGDNHWPLTRIENGKVKDRAFLKDGVVSGAGVNDELGVLSLNGSGYVRFEGFDEDCLTKPDRCPNGFTLSFWLKHGGLISTILGLNAAYHASLDSWLSPLVPKKSRWLPCYRASQDGWTGANFHQNCDGKTSTLTIIKVQDFVFGGYLYETWGPSKSGPIRDSKAFLFSLNNPAGRAPLTAGEATTAATTSPTSLPTFGAYDIVLKDNANTVAQSYTTPGLIYKLRLGSTLSQDFFTDTKYFIVDEIEVFYNEELTTDQAYILTTGAEDPATTGFAVFHNQILPNGPGSIVVVVSTATKTWTLNATDDSKDFRHMVITWHPTKGLKLYENAQLRKSGSVVDSYNGNNKMSMLLGHSESTSSPHSGQNTQIRGLAIWRTVITAKDMNISKDFVCSPLSNDASNSFNWNRTSSTTPTPLTGPAGVFTLLRYLSDHDFYIDFGLASTINSASTYGTVDLNIPRLDVFTACWWSRHDSSVNKELFAIESQSGTRMTVMVPVINSWQHFCLTYTSTCANVLYLNGQSIPDTSIIQPCQSANGPPIKVLIGKFDLYAFDGWLSDFNLWDRHLSAPEISLVSNGCSLIEGNLVAWRNLVFSHDVILRLSHLCKRDISYIESSYPQTKGQSISLLTSEYVPVTVNCLYFQYNLYGKDIGRLNVYLIKGNSQKSLVWSLAGDQGISEWKSVYIPMNNTEKSQVVFEGIVGDGYLGDLSIGNVALTTTDSCSGGTGKEYIAMKGIKSNVIGHLGDYVKTLQTWLASAGLPSSWKTCYRLSRTGWPTSKVLHRRCANKGPTITIVRHSDDIFGAVFDRSWREYGRCSGTIPSSKSFLFSLKGNAGSNMTKLPVKSDASNEALNCTSYQQSFPNFGNDLVVNLGSKNVKGTYGQTYGSTAGSFVNGQDTFEPSDFDILVPEVIFCSSPCPEATSCDEIQGKCACNESSRFFESCNSGVFLDKLTSDAYDFFPMTYPLNLKNLKRPTWGQVINTANHTKGLGGPTISTSEADHVSIGTTHPCLTNPTSCSPGVSVSIWLRYSSPTSSQPVNLFCSDTCQAGTTGISIVLTNPNNDSLTLTVTTEAQRCSHLISFGPKVWTHVVFTWTTELAVYINGQQVSPLSTNCESGHYTANTDRGVVIGKGGAVDVDDFIVWADQLEKPKIQSLHEFYKGRKNMTLEYEFKTSSSVPSPDKELDAYKTICQIVRTGITGFLSSELRPKVSVENCVLNPLPSDSSTKVSVSIVYIGMSGYSVAKPLMEQLKTTNALTSIRVTEVLSLELLTVYSTPCQLSVSCIVTTASLSWSCPQAEPRGGILTGYDISVTNLTTGTTQSIKRISGNLFHTVKKLLPETSYNFTVTPVTLEGVGAPSEPVTCTTKSKLLASPYNVTSLNQTTSTIYIYWNLISSADILNIEGFQIMYKTMDSVLLVYKRVASPITEALLSGLNRSTTYQIAVQAYGNNKESQFSAILNASTTDGIPDAAPEVVQGSSINATSVNVTWSPLKPEYADGIVIGYHIESYIATGINAGKNFSSRMSCRNLVDLHNLYPFTDYYVNVSAFTIHGVGPEVQVYIPNKPTVPNQPPSSVISSKIRRTAINITWGAVPPGSSFVPITGYMVWYREHLPSPSSASNFTIPINDSMSCLIEGLKEYTEYDIRVAAINRAGVGVYSSEMVVRTAEGAPTGIVSNATTDSITLNSSLIQWNPLPPSAVPGVLAGYVITLYDVLRNVNTTRIVCGSTTSAELIELFPYTEYLVYMSGFTKGGAGNISLVTSFFTLEAAPDAPPQNVTSHNSSSSSIELTWLPPPITNINGKLGGYEVTWFKTLGDGQEVFNETIDIQSLARRRRRSVSDPTLQTVTLTLSGLEKFTMYTIRILSFTIANGPFFETNTTTAEDVPSVPPPNIIACNSSSTSISVSWQPIPEEARHGVFFGYHVLYQEASQLNVTPPLVVTVNHSVFNLELLNLKKFTFYVVLVAGFTTPGTGILSIPLNVSTDEDVPDEAPVSLAGTALSISELSFTWQPVAADKHNGIIRGYTLVLNPMDNSLANANILINNASILTTEAAGLVSWTNYTAMINAFTSKGQGPWSPGVLVTTLEELPLPPTTVTAQMLSATTISVTWSPSNTTFLRGILRGYRVTYTPRGSVFPNDPSNVTTNVDTLSTVLTGLHEFTEYDITIAGFTIADGNQSQPVIAKTDSAPPSAGPSPLGSLGDSPNSITLVLGSVPPADSNGVIVSYKVVTTKVGSSELPLENVYGPMADIALIEGLLPYTQYLFQVFASTDKGWGLPSNITLRSGEAAPDGHPTYDDGNTRFSMDSIPLKWAPLTPDEANGKVLGYRVSYQLVSLGDEPVEDAPVIEFDVNDTTSTLIKNLELYGGYKMTIAGFTSKGFGPPVIVYGETCRCRKTLYANWRVYSPYVELHPETGELEGIFPDMVKEMTQECCQKCVSHNESVVEFTTGVDGTPSQKQNEDELKTNISEKVDFSFPLFGTKEQKTYAGGFGYRALIETPGIVYVVNINTGEDEGPHMTIINSLVGCLPYILLTVLLAYLAGFVVWILDREINSEFFPLTFIKGTYEGLWWAFITMTTLGYGDRFPKSFWAKVFAIYWMLSGIVIYGILSGVLQTAVTTITVTIDTTFNGKKIIAIHNSPEFRLGQRLNIPMNKEIQPRTFQEMYDALIQRKAHGAFIDAYAIGQQKHLFEHPTLKFVKIYDIPSAYGIVLGGTSWRLRTCFNRYLKDKRAEVSARVAKYTKFAEAPPEELPRTMEYSSGLFTADTNVFNYTLFTLLAIWFILMALGCIYEVIRRKTTKVRDEKLEVLDELRRDTEEFVDNMRNIKQQLQEKHQQQVKQWLKENKKMSDQDIIKTLKKMIS